MVFDALPASYVMKSDADGKFSVNLPKGASYVLAARATRLVGKESEKYFWMLAMKVPADDELSLFLSNDNLIKDIPDYSRRLQMFFPTSTTRLPALDFERALAKWTFDPPMAVASAVPEIQRGNDASLAKATRKGDMLSIADVVTAEIIDESGSTVGLFKLPAGTEIAISEENGTHMLFIHGSERMRIAKNKIDIIINPE